MRPRWGAHFSDKIQERILNAVVRDVRRTALEFLRPFGHASVFFRARSSTTRSWATNNSRPCTSNGRDAMELFGRHSIAGDIPDEIQGVAELSRSFEGETRVALTTALEAVHEAAQRRDPVKEVRAWKLFSY